MDDRHFGTVIWFTKTHGFIARENKETDIFVHWSDIAQEGFKTLSKDQRVSFSIGLNKHGQPKATEVRIEP